MEVRDIYNTASSVAVNQDCVIVSLSGTVTARSVDGVLREITAKKQVVSSLGTAPKLVVDLSKVVAVMPDGATSLVCLCSTIMTPRMGHVCTPSAIFLRLPSENVVTYLTRIGFFTLMSVKANLLGLGDLVRAEESWRLADARKRTDGANRRISPVNRPVVWPMHIVGQKSNHSTYRHFEDDCQQLVNSASDHFDELFSIGHFNFDNSDKHNFLHSLYELYMNVYEHSFSWGLTMLHARPNYGTFICCHDIGIGFKAGLTDSPNVKEKIESDHQAIRWALVYGHSRKADGSGQGLKDVENFVFRRKGVMTIRSGEALLQKGPEDSDWRSRRVAWFPGAQINIFVPTRGN